MESVKFFVKTESFVFAVVSLGKLCYHRNKFNFGVRK